MQRSQLLVSDWPPARSDKEGFGVGGSCAKGVCWRINNRQACVPFLVVGAGAGGEGLSRNYFIHIKIFHFSFTNSFNSG